MMHTASRIRPDQVNFPMLLPERKAFIGYWNCTPRSIPALLTEKEAVEVRNADYWSTDNQRQRLLSIQDIKTPFVLHVHASDKQQAVGKEYYVGNVGRRLRHQDSLS